MKDRKQFENHAIWNTLVSIKNDERINSLPLGSKNYLLFLINDLEKRKQQTNPYYVSLRCLNGLQQKLANVKNNLTNSANVDRYVEECMESIAESWPANSGRMTADIQKNTYESSMQSAKKMLQQNAEAADRVEALEKAAQDASDSVQHEITALRESASKEIESIESMARESIDSLNTKHEEAVTNLTEVRNTELDEIREQYISGLKNINSDAERLFSKVSNRTSKISGVVIAEEYGKYARNKTVTTWVYDILAIAFAITGVALVAVALTAFQTDDTSARVFKLAVSVAAFTVSGYLFRRGTFNQREARAAKRTDLALRQCEPFIATLAPETQAELTRDIAERIFVNGTLDEEVQHRQLITRDGISSKDVEAIAALVNAIKPLPEQ